MCVHGSIDVCFICYWNISKRNCDCTENQICSDRFTEGYDVISKESKPAKNRCVGDIICLGCSFFRNQCTVCKSWICENCNKNAGWFCKQCFSYVCPVCNCEFIQKVYHRTCSYK